MVLGSLALAPFGPALVSWRGPALQRTPRFSSSPFTLGVASGDPDPSSVVLWTRLAPDPLNGGGMPDEPVDVGWQIAADENMRRIVGQGTTTASPAFGHAVHVDAGGLEPDRWYWYRFIAGNEESPVGRTRTMPAEGAAVERLRFAFASCQHFETGYYTAYAHLAQEDLDLVFHLGDYIYENAGIDGRVRKHAGSEIASLADYRNRYAQYKLDPHLQAAHALCPWIVTPDDHEVDNNYANATSEHDDPRDAFLGRRTAAYQAYYEHTPLRVASRPSGPAIQLYRSFRWGQLASFFVLDTRQYRTNQPCGDGTKAPCAGVYDAMATLMGGAQEGWLFEGMTTSTARWNVVPQQVMIAPVDRQAGPGERFAMDQWGGYDAARTRLMRFLAESRVRNPVVLTGDIHSNWVNDLKVDFFEPKSPVVATEFVGTSITSSGDGADVPEAMQAVVAENPFVKFYNGQRGYVACEVTPSRMRAHYRVLEYVSRPGAPIRTRASFVVDAGRPGAVRL
jgi:alkaline phosphatase D